MLVASACRVLVVLELASLFACADKRNKCTLADGGAGEQARHADGGADQSGVGTDGDAAPSPVGGNGGAGGNGGSPAAADVNPWREGFLGCQTASWCTGQPTPRCTPPAPEDWPPGGVGRSPLPPFRTPEPWSPLTFTGVPSGITLMEQPLASLVPRDGGLLTIVGNAERLSWNPNPEGGYVEVLVEQIFKPDGTADHTQTVCRVPVGDGSVDVSTFPVPNPALAAFTAWQGSVWHVLTRPASDLSGGRPEFGRRLIATLARTPMP